MITTKTRISICHSSGNSHGRTRLLGISLSPKEDFAALHRSETLFEVVHLSIAGHASYSLPLPKHMRLLGYHWTPKSSLHDLILIHTGGLALYKVSAGAVVKVETVKSVSVAIDSYWLESKTGILVVAKSCSKPGQMLTFRVSGVKSLKRLEGPKFTLGLTNANQSMWNGATNEGTSVLSKKEKPANCCSLGRLYDSVYFAHFSAADGAIRLYRIGVDSVVLAFGPVCVPEKSLCSVRMLDSLLVLRSAVSSTEFIYDIETPWCITRPFCVIAYESSENSQESGTTGSFGNVFHSERQMMDGLLAPDHDIWIDIVKGRCYKAHISPFDLVRNLRNKLDAVLFLMRRVGGKYEALTLLRKCLVQGGEILHICGFFEALRIVHFDVASEANTVLKTVKHREIEESPHKMDPEDEALAVNKAKVDICHSYQREMCEFVFAGLCDAQDIDRKYQLAVLLEFARSLLSEDLPLAVETELQIAKFLLSHRDFDQLQDLLEYGVLTLNAEMCDLLAAFWLSDSQKSEIVRLALVDTLHALDMREDLYLLLSEAGFDFEASVCEMPTPQPEFQRSSSLTHTNDI